MNDEMKIVHSDKDSNEPDVPYKSTKPPTVPPVSTSSNSNSPILVNVRQKGNPVLKFVRKVCWRFDESFTNADFMICSKVSLSTSANPCKSIVAFFLSVRYHSLNPDYIHDRLKASSDLPSTDSNLRVLLVHVDVREPHNVLKDLMRIAILANLTLMLAWSAEEAGQILETYKMYENRGPEAIQEKLSTNVEPTFPGQNAVPPHPLVPVLTTIRSVNKKDAVTLLGTFGSFKGILDASVDELVMCPGFGRSKAQRVYNVLHHGFK